MKVGPYELAGELGRGGAGVVYRARTADGRTVALKLLGRPPKPESRERFERERRLLASFTEAEGFVPLIDAGEDARGGPWLAMAFVPGGTLRKRLQRGALGVPETLALGAALAGAMAHAHERGIVHRDLKPENVLFTADGRPLIADLGLAKHFDDTANGASRSVSLSVDGSLRGTAGYMAPEQMHDSKSVGPEADVFALGAILWECLAGVPAFEGQSVVELVEKVATGHVRPIATVRPGTPRALAAAIHRALALAPEDRFESAAALRDALEAAGCTKEPSRRGWAPVVGAGVLLLAAAGALLAWKLGAPAPAPGPAPPPPGPPPRALPAPPPAAGTPPEWFRALPEQRRPRLPLPAPLTFGEAPFEYVATVDGSVLVYIPPLTVIPIDRDRQPVAGFFIGKLEVSNRQFAAYRAEHPDAVTQAENAGGWIRVRSQTDTSWAIGHDANWRTPLGDGTPCVPEHPVVQVTWTEADAYARAARLRLPTANEWLAAAYWKPDEEPVARVVPDGLAGIPPGTAFAHELAPCGSAAQDVTASGVHDMACSVMEWVADVDTRLGPQGFAYHLQFGGAWYSPKKLTPKGTSDYKPDFAVGLRVALSASR